MAVVHGKDSDAYFNGYDAGLWLNECTSSAQKDLKETTVYVNNAAKEYRDGLRSAKMSAKGFYHVVTEATPDVDDGDYAIDAALNNQTTTEDILLFFPGGASTLGDRGVGLSGNVTNYDIETPAQDLNTVNIEMESNVGRDPVLLLAAKANRTNSFTGTSIDNSASSSNGGVGYCMGFDRTSGTLPVLIEHSTNDSVWSTLITFSNITSDHTKERIAVTGTVNRYIRASANGTYVNEFLVAFRRK